MIEIVLPKEIEKPWGKEILIVQTEHYAAKVLVVKAGQRLSLQYHEKKHETIYLESGKILLTLGKEGKEMVFTSGMAIIIPPGFLHRIHALEDSRLFEASTPELDDVVRIADDYGREEPSND